MDEWAKPQHHLTTLMYSRRLIHLDNNKRRPQEPANVPEQRGCAALYMYISLQSIVKPLRMKPLNSMVVLRRT